MAIKLLVYFFFLCARLGGAHVENRRWEGYTKSDDTPYYGIGVYPQPPVNFMLKLSYRF